MKIDATCRDRESEVRAIKNTTNVAAVDEVAIVVVALK